ncbi:MAG: hypothetical protein BGP03_10195 [Pseudonocardia sp. 73-21]|nr:MAG: hypothetical protein BGP03_10195 [Pseudonocardia sp. 73-21]
MTLEEATALHHRVFTEARYGGPSGHGWASEDEADLIADQAVLQRAREGDNGCAEHLLVDGRDDDFRSLPWPDWSLYRRYRA